MNPFWTVSLFWFATAVCVVVALAFVLPALLRARGDSSKAGRRDVNIAVYRDQLKELEAEHANGLLSVAQYQNAKQELEARLADDALGMEDVPGSSRVSSRKLGYTLAAILPIAAFGLYFWLGNPASLITEAQSVTAPHAMTSAEGQHDFAKLIRQVEEKTRANPDDAAAWAMQAKTYAAMERWPEAVQAYEKAVALLPRDASLLSGYAEALAISNNRVLTGRPIELVQQALAIDPADMKSLELAGIHAYQTGNFVQASAYFKQLHGLLPPESDYARDILAAQRDAEGLVQQHTAGLDRLDGSPSDNKTASTVAGATIQGSVDIEPALKSRLAETDVLFLFARSGSGGPPIAAIRARAGTFPLEFELDDSTAMTPGNALSHHKQVMLVARLSKSGNPVAQSGDFEGRVADVAVGARGVKLVVDQVLP